MPSVFERALARIRSSFKREPDDYAARLGSELDTYKDCLDVNDLPQIFHYWSNKYLAPKFTGLGISHPDELFARHLAQAAKEKRGRATFVSIGAGNCDTEVRVAKLLKTRGLDDFEIECVDINPDMLKRGREMAEAEGVVSCLSFTAKDFNKWNPPRRYDAVMANQSLHHVLSLEGLFDAIKDAISPHGLFVASDIIGRNGHLRWPEAAAILREFWKEMPTRYRYNHLLRRLEEEFMDWDCSGEGFEGIRAQDVLPLLVDRFEFDLFAPFANVIDPLIDRGFGHNFDATAEWDRDFIDRVHLRDESEILAGRIKPTHMMAVMCVGRPGRMELLDGLEPRACIRWPG